MLSKVAASLCLFSLPCALAAQHADTTRPVRSLAAGLVRQCIEVEKRQPPKFEAGLEIGAGKGPLVLLVRGSDGAVRLQELQRGEGDHGPEVKPMPHSAPEEQEEGAEEVSGPAGLSLRVLDGKLSIATGKTELWQGKAVDRAALRPHLSALRTTTAATDFADQLLLEPTAAVTLEQVLVVWEVARTLGFQKVLLGAAPDARGRLLDTGGRQIAGLAEHFGWPVAHKGPGGTQPVCAGELLVLMDGSTPWGEVSLLLRAFAKAGIWQIAFVGQKDATTFVKLPTPLPMDGAM